MIASYRDLRLWQLGMDVSEDVYRLVSGFPRPEASVLVAQLQRAAIAIPAQVAQGQARGQTGEYLQHLRDAQGSLAETMTLLELAVRLGYLKSQQLVELRTKADSLTHQLKGLRTAIADRSARN